ncbi:MAG: integrase [Gammaproteobacteria bacterium RIFCSPHIGHO2_12_FULL_38_11]|nr:MAG: integrase [Gammaproteobacteria bacterium RIFCSPHIGHO2_12_FULL_38_11]
MDKENKIDAVSRQALWARFRFGIIGPLLSAPPDSGELKSALTALSEKTWKNPMTGLPLKFSVSTLERWFYRAKRDADPVGVLRTKRRTDASVSRKLNTQLKIILQNQYRDHPSWSCQLHLDNLRAIVKNTPELGAVPSYSTLHRHMKAQGLHKRRIVKRRFTEGALIAQEKLENREIRSFEVDHVHGLWHLDFHHGSRKIIGKDGKWYKPLLLAILDDHSRLICHAQWYLHETAEVLVHGFKQALQKRGLPRALMSDNGSAMMSAEFTQGLERLGILHQPTLPYSPYQNAKQEVFWAQVEGRLMAMLEGENELTLPLMNETLIAWIEFEYHRKFHSEINATPLDRYLNAKNVGRACPNTLVLNQSFCEEGKRKQRRSDGTFTINGARFEVPNHYRHMNVLHVRYARWDLSHVQIIDPHTNHCIDTVYPQDKSANANGLRRQLSRNENLHADKSLERIKESSGIAPLLKDLMAQYAATGLPPAYLPKNEEKKEENNDE